MFSKFLMAIKKKIVLKGVKYGQKVFVFGKPHIIEPKNLSLGDNVSINHGCYINCTNSVQIGNDVLISAGAKIVSTGLDYEKWSHGAKCHEMNAGVVIGDHVWICTGAIILPNVRITGKYVVVAAGAVVTKDINEDNVVVAGIPAKVIRRY